MNWKNLKENIEKKLDDKPPFIVLTDSRHELLYEWMLQANDIIKRLLTTTCLSQNKIKNYQKEFDIHLQTLLEHLPAEWDLAVGLHYHKTLLNILDICKQFEVFEVCFNIQTFIDYHFNLQ